MTDSGMGGSTGCRCSCQTDLASSEFDLEGSEPRSSCCSPQIFTSVLLGILACVLVVGGVFLSFHRWDPMWLLVSGIGIILIFIGSILHCTSSSQSDSRTRSAPGTGKGCRTLSPDHHHPNHQIAHNGSLTEQLLPLSNARSVSQLSLNMLPGYFPPVVSTYGIEQHSAVVQNINRIIQQQQLQQQQSQPQSQQQSQQQVTTGSISPGVCSANSGKNFILLSLPADTNPANIQNLLATVYQLDGSVSTENAAVDVSRLPSESPSLIIPPPALPIFKNAEVQTCNSWPTVTALENIDVNNRLMTATASASTTNCASETPRTAVNNTVSTASIVTQTEDAIETTIPINLMDCGSDLPPVCDNTQTSGASEIGALIVIPDRQSNLLVEVLEPCATLVDVPKSSSTNFEGVPLVNILDPSSDFSGDTTPSSSILVDVPSSCEALANIPVMSSDSIVCESEPSFNGLCGSSNEHAGQSESSNVLVGQSGSTSNVIVEQSGSSNTQAGQSDSSSNVFANLSQSTSYELIDARLSSNVCTSEFSSAIQGPSTSTALDVPLSVYLPDEQNACENLVNGREVINTNVISPEIQFACNITDDETAHVLREDSAPVILSDENLTTLDCLNSRLSLSGSGNDLSSFCVLTDGETDDGDSVGRSSPPPSYEDATNENSDEATLGAFGLGYGTI